ncbi:MAG: hypothetical protein CVU56_12835 [Deltaproteobacteria bacterium HGW-Deltaproteobacteria-14]|jgi:DNA-binding NarL/FixJ family response regulator|nr:MAG: hypothetical protein CVU56_12835 [Deltaproteobacteria bacterium HGW-Deltaproteobacteria-14]
MIPEPPSLVGVVESVHLRSLLDAALAELGPIAWLDARQVAVSRPARGVGAVVIASAPSAAETVLRVARIAAQPPECALIAVVDGCDDQLLGALVRAGARGVLLVESIATRAAAAVAEVRAGGIAFYRGVGLALLELVREAEPSAVLGDLGLTQREEDVVALLARGLPYREIAAVLGISVNTVRSHIRTLYAKLGASSKGEAVFRAFVQEA